MPRLGIWILLSILVGNTFIVQAKTPEYLVIANESVAETAIDVSTLRQIFTARKQFWSNGAAIKVVMQQQKSSEHTHFCRYRLGMFPYQLQRMWLQVTYSGQGDAAVIVDSTEDLMATVKATPGAVGYIPADTKLIDGLIIVVIKEAR